MFAQEMRSCVFLTRGFNGAQKKELVLDSGVNQIISGDNPMVLNQMADSMKEEGDPT